jgi:hypothetical protein
MAVTQIERVLYTAKADMTEGNMEDNTFSPVELFNNHQCID